MTHREIMYKSKDGWEIEGYFHQFILRDGEVLAIVEDMDGHVETVPSEDIRFCNHPTTASPI